MAATCMIPTPQHRPGIKSTLWNPLIPYCFALWNLLSCDVVAVNVIYLFTAQAFKRLLLFTLGLLRFPKESVIISHFSGWELLHVINHHQHMINHHQHMIEHHQTSTWGTRGKHVDLHA